MLLLLFGGRARRVFIKRCVARVFGYKGLRLCQRMLLVVAKSRARRKTFLRG